MSEEIKFKKDDKVVVVSTSKWRGQIGKVKKVEGSKVIVKVGTFDLLFDDHELELET